MKKIKKNLLMLLITVTVLLSGIVGVSAESVPGEIIVSKSATKEDTIYGRSATIKLGIDANSFTTVDKTDVVLVIDRSTSMAGTKMDNTIKAAKDLINLIINNNTKSKVRLAIVTYGNNIFDPFTSESLTNNNSTLISLVDSITSNYNENGTNIHAGLLKANNLLSKSENGTNKIVILLSDGEPYQYIGTDNKTVCESDTHKKVCKSTPSGAAKDLASSMKNNNIKIYTVGFDIKTNTEAQQFLKNVSSNPDSEYSYLADNYSNLTKAFEAMVKSFSVVATNGKVIDIIPKEFDVKPSSLPSGITVNKKTDGTTELTWNIGDISSISNKELSYKIEAKENYYGNIYTNIGATLTATSVTGNPIYGSSKPISIKFNKPTIPVPGITVNDIYKIEQGKTLNITTENGILKNDKLTKISDDSATVIDKIVLVSDNTTGNVDDITVDTIKGSFTYKANKNIVGDITYKYYIESTVNTTNGEKVVKSNTSTITIQVSKISTNYIVHYYKEGTKEALSKDKIVNNVNVYEEINEEAIDIKGYTAIKPISKKLILESDNNEFVFYYKANKEQYKVNYLEKGTDEILDKQKVKEAYFKDKINALDEQIKIPGYEYDSVDKNILEITDNKEENIINVYYKKRNNFSYTVNYLEKDTNKVLKSSKTVSNQTFKTIIKTSDEIIEIKDYKYDYTDNKSLTISTGENIINIYYVNDTGSVKTIYVNKDNKEITDSVTTTGKINTDYKTTTKKIEKYKLIKVEGNETGKYTKEDILVTYVYEKVPETGIYKNNNPLYASMISMVVFSILLIIKKKICN